MVGSPSSAPPLPVRTLVESRRAAAAAEMRVAFLEAELEKAAAEVLRLQRRDV